MLSIEYFYGFVYLRPIYLIGKYSNSIVYTYAYIVKLNQKENKKYV